MITHTYDLDIVPGSVPVVVHVSQYDEDVRLVFNLYASTGVLTLESGTTVAIRGTKPDGNGISVDCTLSGSAVTVPLTQQMTAAWGYATFELTLYKNNKELNTANFILDIERAALDKDTLKSGSEIRELVDIIDRTDEIIAAARQSDNAKEAILALSEQVTADKKTTGEYKEAAEQALSDTQKTKKAAETSIEENELYFEIIALEALNEDPIITSSFNTTEVSQYTAIISPQLCGHFLEMNALTHSSCAVLKRSDNFKGAGYFAGSHGMS